MPWGGTPCYVISPHFETWEEGPGIIWRFFYRELYQLVVAVPQTTPKLSSLKQDHLPSSQFCRSAFWAPLSWLVPWSGLGLADLRWSWSTGELASLGWLRPWDGWDDHDGFGWDDWGHKGPLSSRPAWTCSHAGRILRASTGDCKVSWGLDLELAWRYFHSIPLLKANLAPMLGVEKWTPPLDGKSYKEFWPLLQSIAGSDFQNVLFEL